MGQSKGGGYMEKQTTTPEQMSLLNQILQSSNAFTNQAAGGYAQFLPGGGGGEAIKAQAQRDFQQQTIPSILNTFGAGSKGSTSLNQALAGGAADLNTNLASKLSELQLGAAQGLGQLGLGQQQLGLGTGTKAFLERQPNWFMSILPALITAAGTAGGAALGGPAGAMAGGALGGALGKGISGK